MVLGKMKGNVSKDNGSKQSTKPKPMPRTKVPAKVLSEYKTKSSVKQNSYSEKKVTSNFSSKNESTRDSKYKSRETERSFRPKPYDYESKTEQNKSAELRSKSTSINNNSYKDREAKNEGAVPKTMGTKPKYKENIPKDDYRNSRQSNISAKNESRKSIYPSLNINDRNYEEENMKPEPTATRIDKKNIRPKSRSLLSLSTPDDSPKLSVYKHNDQNDKELKNENRNSLSLEALIDSETKASSNSTVKTNLKAAPLRNSKPKSKPEFVNGVNSDTVEHHERQEINHNSKTSGEPSRGQRISSQDKSSNSSAQNSRNEKNQPYTSGMIANSQRSVPNSNSSKPTSSNQNNLNVNITNNYNQYPKSVTKNENKVNSNSKSTVSPNKGYLHIATIASITQKFGLGPMRKHQQIKGSKKTKYTQNTSINRGREATTESWTSHEVREGQRIYDGTRVNQNISFPDQSTQITENPRPQPQENRISIPYRDYDISSLSSPNSESNRTGNSANIFGNRYPILTPVELPQDPEMAQANGASSSNNNVRTRGTVNQAIAPTTFTRNGYSSKKIKIPLKTLQNFRDAYEKITKIIQKGKEHILSGDYKQACSDFENGLKLMDCVLEVSVDSLQLPTLDATMCKSIQEVIFMDRKSALEGFSDAQAGILPPRDMENSMPSGAPPSYTEVLRQDLLKTFSGKGSGHVFGKQESTQDILLDSNYNSSNSSPTDQHLENISTDQAINLSDRSSTSYSESYDLDYNIYSSHDVVFSRGVSLNESSASLSNDSNGISRVPLHKRNPSAPDFCGNKSFTVTILPSLNTTERNFASIRSDTNDNILKENSNLDALVTENSFLSSNSFNESMLPSETVNFININDQIRNDDNDIEASSHGTLTDIESCFTGSSTSVNSFDFHLARTVSLPSSGLKYSVNKSCDFEEFNSYDASCSNINKSIDSPNTSPETNVKNHSPNSCAVNLIASSRVSNNLLTKKEYKIKDTAYPITEQHVNDPLNNLSLLELQNLPPPIPSITDLKIPQNYSPSKDLYFSPDVCKTVQNTRKEERSQEDSVTFRYTEVNDMQKAKKRPPVPTPRRFLKSKEATREQMKLSSPLTEVELDKSQLSKPLTNTNREYKDVFSQQQLSIYSKSKNPENCKKTENIYANIEELQNMLKKRQYENKQPTFSFPASNLFNEGFEKKNLPMKNENIPISDSLVKSRCEAFTSWNQDNKSNSERDPSSPVFTEDTSNKINYKVYSNYDYIRGANSHKILNNKDIGNNSNSVFNNNDMILSQPSKETVVASNFRGAIPKMEYKESTYPQKPNSTNYSRPILKSSPESSCTSPVKVTNFKKSWSTGHGVFGPRNTSSNNLKYTPSLLREFDPLSQKQNSIIKDDINVNPVSLKSNNSNISSKIDTVDKLQVLDTQVQKPIIKTEHSDFKTSIKQKEEDPKVKRVSDISSQNPQLVQYENKKLESRSLNPALGVLNVSSEHNFECEDSLKEKISAHKKLSQVEPNTSPKAKEKMPDQNVLTSQNFPQDFLKPMESASNPALQSCFSRKTECTPKDNVSKISLPERTKSSELETRNPDAAGKNNTLHENISKIQKLPEDFLRPQNSKSELTDQNLSGGYRESIHKATPITEELPIYPVPVSCTTNLESCQDSMSIDTNKTLETRDHSGDHHTHPKTPETPENVLTKKDSEYKYNSKSSLKGKNDIAGASGIAVGQSEFFVELKEETIPNLPSMAQWREILFIDEIKMYFIKNETEIQSPFYRPNLQVLEEITFGRNIMNPTVKLLVLPQKGSPHWTRDLSMENVKVFKTVGGAFIFSSTDGIYVGIKFSVKTNFKKISKFMSLLTSHTYFEKEISRKTTNPSKVSKIFADLVGTKADKFQVAAKDVTRQSMRTIKFAKNALGVKDQQIQRSYQEPLTENTFGTFVELQKMGKLLEKNIIENNIKYY